MANFIAVAIPSSAYDGIQCFNGFRSSSLVQNLCQSIFLPLLIMWVDSDSRINRRSERCFGYAFLVFILYPVYVPYYLCRTRGFILGTMSIVGLCLPFGLSGIVRWVIQICIRTAGP